MIFSTKKSAEGKMTQRLEKQLAFPGMKLEAIAAAPEPKAKKGLKPRTYGIIGAIVLSATVGAACYVNKALNDASQAMMGFQALPGRMIDHLNNSLYEEIWKTTDSDKEKYPSKK